MMNRHGLIAGATGTGKTKTLQGIAEQLSAAGVPVFVADVKGDVSGPRGARATPAGRRAKRNAELGVPFAPTGVPGRVPLARRHRPGRAGARDGLGLRAAAARQGPRRQRDAGAEPRASSSTTPTTKGLPLLDLADLRALLTFLDSDEGKAELEGIGGLSRADGRRAAARAGRRSRTAAATSSSASRSSTSPTCCAPRPTAAAIISCLELPAVQDKPDAVLDRADVAASPSCSRRCPRSATSTSPSSSFFFDEAHLLFDDATEAFLESVDADGAADPLQGRRRLLRHPDAEGRAGRRARPARQPRPARAARVHARRRQGAARRPSRRSRSPTFYDLEELLHVAGHRRGGGHDPRPRAACRRRSCTRGCSRRARAWRRPTTSTAPPRPRRCARSTARGPTPRARARCSPASARRPAAPPSRPRRRRSREKQHKEAAKAPRGRRCDALGDFLGSRQGKALQKEVVRGVFGMLKKRL